MIANITLCFFFFNDTATTEIYTLSLHDALPISLIHSSREVAIRTARAAERNVNIDAGGGHSGLIIDRSEEHTSELQSQSNLVCRLLLEKKKTTVSRLDTASSSISTRIPLIRS